MLANPEIYRLYPKVNKIYRLHSTVNKEFASGQQEEELIIRAIALGRNFSYQSRNPNSTPRSCPFYYHTYGDQSVE